MAAAATVPRPRSISVDRLVGLTEIATRFDVQPGAVWNWTRRYDFPAPIARVSNTPIYDWDEVSLWKSGWVRSKRGRSGGRG